MVGTVAHGVEVPATAAVMTRPERASGSPIPQRLSIGVSDLRTFKQCPRRYEYQRRWQLPVRASVSSWYGSLMHQVLHQAGTQRMAGVTVDGDLVAAQWHAAWDASRGPKGLHRDLRAHGEEQLRRYVASPAWSAATIESVEEPVGLDLDAAHVRGRFDRVDRQADGTPTVVDYKTGNPHDEASLRRDLQLRAYAVAAAQRAHADDVAVEFHYLHTGDVVRVVADRKFLNTAYRHLSLTAQDIAFATRDGLFPPKPSRWQCTHCDYRTICDEGTAAARDSA
jgi:DNA helicase-2/ATP-dependent DNA helicase PcrA